jgi:hypothetical protein
MIPRRLTAGQRALLVTCCTDHAIFACAGCGRKVMLADLFAQLWADRPDFYPCPSCGSSVAGALHAHFTGCPFIAGMVSTRTRRAIVEERQPTPVREVESERGRDVTAKRRRRVWGGLPRCSICRRRLSASSNIVILNGQAIHLACRPNQATPAAS